MGARLLAKLWREAPQIVNKQCSYIHKIKWTFPESADSAVLINQLDGGTCIIVEGEPTQNPLLQV
jgi:hypothetical protein